MKFEKITLRALEPEDLELLYKWENDKAYPLLPLHITAIS
jgi:hypothetical protein